MPRIEPSRELEGDRDLPWLDAVGFLGFLLDQDSKRPVDTHLKFVVKL